jgi:hypothetical protein
MPVAEKAPYVIECGGGEDSSEVWFFTPEGTYHMVEFWLSFGDKNTITYSEAGEQLRAFKRTLKRAGCTKVTHARNWP